MKPDGASRLGNAFASSRGHSGLIPYLTAGYPSLEVSLELMRGFERAGALAIELGIPFSDPIADGPDIQRASEWAHRLGIGAPEVLDLAAEFRRSSSTPLVVMTYSNPMLRMGVERFGARAREASVDAVLLTDLPPDEAPEVWDALAEAGLDSVVLVAPTTRPERIPLLLERCSGFVYCLSRTGVTGAGGGDAGAIDERIADLRQRTSRPIAVGFGISTPADALPYKGLADAVVVGAAFTREIARDLEHGAVERTETLARAIRSALG